MNWTKPEKPKKGVSHYDHIICETPMGRAIVEWKGWKEFDTYSVTIGDDYVGDGWNLDEAKDLAKEWIVERHRELSSFLSIKSITNKL